MMMMMIKSRKRIGKGMERGKRLISVVKYVPTSFSFILADFWPWLVIYIASLPVIQPYPTFIIPTAPSLIHHGTILISYPHLPSARATKSESFVHDRRI